MLHFTRSMRFNGIAWGLCLFVAAGGYAQVPGSEIKKTLDGYCLLKDTPAYTLATQFVLQKNLGECLQSGGILPPPPEGVQPNGLQSYCRGVDCVDSLSKFKATYPIAPSGQPRPLPLVSGLSPKQRTLIHNANRIFDANPTLAMLLVEKGEIIFERYHPQIGSHTPLLGYSMSKTLTALTVGRLHCAGLLPDLDRQAKSYDERLAGTQYGEASVRQLLMMASGAARGAAIKGGNPLQPPAHLPYAFPGSPWYAGYADMRRQLHDYGAPQKKQDQSGVKAGEEFSYKNLDTQALSFVAGGQGRPEFSASFANLFWPSVQAEQMAYWIHDQNGITHTPASFHATLRDWARIGLHIMDERRTPTADCYNRFVEKASTTQISNQSKKFGDDHWIGRSFKGYGYQIWTENFEDPSGTFYLNGYRGQRIAINPERQQMMVVFSVEETYMDKLYQLFASWK
jgi:CubicO group peptidase (beta-lactamase class C family)